MDNIIFANLVTLQAAVGAATEGRPPREQLDPLALVLDASPVVMLVLLVLVAMWLTWLFITGAKLVQLLQAGRQSNRFLDLFWSDEHSSSWSAERLEGIYGQIRTFPSSPLAAVFRAGYVELARMASHNEGYGAGADLENIERALKRTANNELTGLENLVPMLGTIGSTAPFIGLFGTVWGIMNSFIAIHGDKSASLEVVAPGIAEALIATAIGLAAAIPSVMAYNYFVRRIHVLESEMESFQSDYLNIVRRHFLPH